MSTFDDYYKKWKERNNITSENSYQNLTDKQKAQNAMQSIDETFNRYRAISNQKSTSTNTWNQVQNVANNNLNRFNNINNTRNLISNISNTSNNNALVDYVFNSSGNAVNRQRENKNTLTKNNEIDKNEHQDLFDVIHNKEKENNKNSMLFSEQNNEILPMKKNNENNSQKKNENIIQDTSDVAVLTALGVSTGSKNVLNYIESANENIYSNYKNQKKQQFLTSPKVNEIEKATAKTQDNLLLQKNSINVEDKIETNLIKKAIRDSINKDEEEIAEIGRISAIYGTDDSWYYCKFSKSNLRNSIFCYWFRW